MMNDIQLSFEAHEDLAVCMCEMARDANTIVYAVVFYDDAKRLLQMLGSIEEVDFGNIELNNPQWNGYNKEYYVSVDENFEVNVEPAWHEKNEYHDAGYYRADNSIALIHSDANSKILEALKDCDCAEFEIDADAECDGCCEECMLSDEDDEDSECDFADILEYVMDNLPEIIERAITLN